MNGRYLIALASGLMLFACTTLPPPPPLTPQERLIARGREIFFDEKFNGNGRTCGTCHRAEDNMTLDPALIATLPPNDPLFVAENNPALRQNFENPQLMRAVSLIMENLDGFGDLTNKFTMRGVPHTLGLRQSVSSAQGPRTGWSGDGAPGDRSLRSFAVGAVIQHFTRTLNRVPGVDFRLPTGEELDALEAFQLALGRQVELNLPLPFKSPVVARGQELFNSRTAGKCFTCHFNAGANGAPNVFGPTAGNLNFNTGVEDLPDQPADLLKAPNPPDDGFGTPGDSTFNTPSLVEAADSGPFFHNNSIETIEGAVAFYGGKSFNNSPAGQTLKNATGSGIELDGTQVVAIAAFLRALNALENIRQTVEILEASIHLRSLPQENPNHLLARAVHETDDAMMVLSGGGLHPQAVARLQRTKSAVQTAAAARSFSEKKKSVQTALSELRSARVELVQEQ